MSYIHKSDLVFMNRVYRNVMGHQIQVLKYDMSYLSLFVTFCDSTQRYVASAPVLMLPH